MLPRATFPLALVVLLGASGAASGCAAEVDRASAAPGTLRADVPIPADAFLTIAPACTVGPGRVVTLRGQLELGGVDARLIVRNNVRGTHERFDDVAASVVLVPADTVVTIPETSATASANAPAIYVQLVDAAGLPLTEEVAIGTCGDAPFPMRTAISLPALANLAVSVSDCANAGGPRITLGGTVELTGLSARLVARDPSTGALEGAVTLGAPVVALAATTLEIPKQPSRGGVGGNPWIWVQLVGADGAPLSDELFVGRCVELADHASDPPEAGS